MKKISLLLLTVVLISGCQVGNTGEEKDNNMQKNIKKETNSMTENKDKVVVTNNETIDPINFKNLIAEYNGVVMKTNLGDIKIKFYNEESPDTVNNFLNLANMDFYDGIKFHRVIKDFMIQCGDPNSKDDNWADDGIGGPGYKFQDEFNEIGLVKGSVAMANSGPNTNGSQFFIVTADSVPWLDGKHTNFGLVVDGMDIVNSIESTETDQRDHPMADVVIEDIELISL